MKKGDVLYRKGSDYELVFTRSQGDELFGYVRTTDGMKWDEQSVISILSKGYWESVLGVEEVMKFNPHHDSQGAR